MNHTKNIMLPASANEVKGISLHLIPHTYYRTSLLLKIKKKIFRGGKKQTLPFS